MFIFFLLIIHVLAAMFLATKLPVDSTRKQRVFASGIAPVTTLGLISFPAYVLTSIHVGNHLLVFVLGVLLSFVVLERNAATRI